MNSGGEVRSGLHATAFHAIRPHSCLATQGSVERNIKIVTMLQKPQDMLLHALMVRHAFHVSVSLFRVFSDNSPSCHIMRNSDSSVASQSRRHIPISLCCYVNWNEIAHYNRLDSCAGSVV
jgi:hypothetical protein